MKDRDTTERLFYLSVGPLAALVLGMALVPLRDFTTASNFTFVFLVLTIVVAEFGGRGPALVTALVSALSLDFFLTRPYLKLSIEAKDDVIAFAGLAVCGLVAAALGTPRGQEALAAPTHRAHLDFLHSMVRGLDGGAPLEPQLVKVLRASRELLPLAAAVVRGEDGAVLASSDPPGGQQPIPDLVLEERGMDLPESGGRIPLFAGKQPLGWLDVWGDGRTSDPESRRTLFGIARLAALLLSTRASAHGG
jgi:Domain of unknown function (DUF4118)